MNLILFDDSVRDRLLPFTFTRPCADIRVGILTIREKWQLLLGASQSSDFTKPYLNVKYPLILSDLNLLLNGSICPDETLAAEVSTLAKGEGLFHGEIPIAFCLGRAEAQAFSAERPSVQKVDRQTAASGFLRIAASYDIFMLNDDAIRSDYRLLTRGRTSAAISATNQVAGAENIFIEKGAKVEFSILNATTGPIYIAKDAEIMEGCLVRGPFSLGENASLKMGAKIYGATTIGPHCKVGGEVNNSVIFGYSNKAHDGFLGNAVVGEWCNFGADTNNSNLKNNYAEVKLWSYASGRFENTGLQYCGLMMGDHSKCGINTMFNTGTVVGVGANIFGAGFPRNFIPSFSWGGAAGFETFQLNKFYELAGIVMKRRGLLLLDADREILKTIFEESAKHRIWELKNKE